MDAFAHMKLRRDQPALMVALRLARDRAGFTHRDVDNATFCRAASGRPVSCDAGCLFLHKPMKYDASNIVVSVGRRGQGGKAVKRALRGPQADRPRRDACVSPDEATPEMGNALLRVLIGERMRSTRCARGGLPGRPKGAAELWSEGTRARAFIVPAAPACHADRIARRRAEARGHPGARVVRTRSAKGGGRGPADARGATFVLSWRRGRRARPRT